MPDIMLGTGMNKPLMKGLVLWLKMSEGVGNYLHDVSGYRNNGAVNGALWVDGKFGKALDFDGISNYVQVLDASSLNLTDAITISCWVKASAPVSDRAFIAKHGTGGGYEVVARNSGAVGFVGRDATGAIIITLNCTPTTVLNNTWTHIAVGYNRVKIQWYVNGVTAGSVGEGDALVVSADALKLGRDTIRDRWFAGILDEVRIYNRALNAYEIAKLFRERGYV